MDARADSPVDFGQEAVPPRDLLLAVNQHERRKVRAVIAVDSVLGLCDCRSVLDLQRLDFLEIHCSINDFH